MSIILQLELLGNRVNTVLWEYPPAAVVNGNGRWPVHSGSNLVSYSSAWWLVQL